MIKNVYYIIIHYGFWYLVIWAMWANLTLTFVVYTMLFFAFLKAFGIYEETMDKLSWKVEHYDSDHEKTFINKLLWVLFSAVGVSMLILILIYFLYWLWQWIMMKS